MRHRVERTTLLGFGIVVALTIVLIFGWSHVLQARPAAFQDTMRQTALLFFGLHLTMLTCLGLMLVGIRHLRRMSRQTIARSGAFEAFLDNEIQRMASVIVTLQELALTDHDLNTVMQAIVECVQQVTKADGSVVALIDGEEIVYCAASGIASAHSGLRLEVATSLSGRCVQENVALRCDDTETDTWVDREVCRRIGLRSMIVVPLPHARSPFGVLKVVSARPHAFHESDVAALQLMAGVIVAAIQRATVQEVKQALSDERDRALQALQESEEKLNQAQALAHVGSWKVNLDSGDVIWSDELFRIFSLDSQSTIPSHEAVRPCLHPDDRDRVEAALQRAQQEGIAEDLECRLVRPDGSLRYVKSHCQVTCDAAGRPARMLGTIQDITTQKQFERQIQTANERLSDANAELQTMNTRLEEQITLVHEQATLLEAQKAELETANKQLEALATMDGLTGIKNHRAFQEKIREEFDRARRYGLPLSLLLLDVDHFKSFNDTFGHPAGDQVLKRVGALLQSTARATDFVARYGGEEFVVILPETARQDAIEAAERFRAAIAEAAWEQRAITVSIGAASLHPATENPARMIREGDKALYASKTGGRNRVTHYGQVSASQAPCGQADDASSVPYFPND